MKKIGMLLLAALPLFAASCGDDNKEPDPVDINFDLTQLNINFGETGQLKCNIEGAQITSSNPFVATVDPSGKVTAKHVGETKIKATIDGYSATATVTVNATNNNFTTPLLLWGSRLEDIRLKALQDNKLVEIQNVPEGSLSFTTAGNFPVYAYSFIDNRLTAAGLSVTEAQDEEGNLYEFLTQRYHEYGEDAETGATYFCDADDVKDASVVLEYGMDLESEDDLFNVIWRENSSTKTRANGGINRVDFDDCRAILRQAAKNVR